MVYNLNSPQLHDPSTSLPSANATVDELDTSNYVIEGLFSQSLVYPNIIEISATEAPKTMQRGFSDHSDNSYCRQWVYPLLSQQQELFLPESTSSPYANHTPVPGLLHFQASGQQLHATGDQTTSMSPWTQLSAPTGYPIGVEKNKRQKKKTTKRRRVQKMKDDIDPSKEEIFDGHLVDLTIYEIPSRFVCFLEKNSQREGRDTEKEILASSICGKEFCDVESLMCHICGNESDLEGRVDHHIPRGHSNSNSVSKCAWEGCKWTGSTAGYLRHLCTDVIEWRCPFQGCNSIFARYESFRKHVKLEHLVEDDNLTKAFGKYFFACPVERKTAR